MPSHCWNASGFFKTATYDPLRLLLGLAAIASGLLLLLAAGRKTKA